MDSKNIRMRESLKVAKEHFGRKIITAIELGVASGVNSKRILEALRLKHLFLIDLWSPLYSDKAYEWLVAVVKQFEGNEKVIPIKCEAIQAAGLFPDGSIDYLYIDDCHNPDHVETEIRTWLPKMTPGGIIAGHDYEEGNGRVEVGVKKVFKEFFHKQNDHEATGDWWVVLK